MPTLFVDFVSAPEFLVPSTIPWARIPGVYIVGKFKLFVRALETWRKVSFSGVFGSQYMYN